MNPKPDHHTNKSEPHHGALDIHDSTSNELSIFNAHKHFNGVTLNNNNNRVSPLLNTNSQHNKHNHPESERDIDNDDVITNTTYSASSSSSTGGNCANIKKNCKAHSFHVASTTPTTTTPSSSCNSQVGFLSSFSTTRNNFPYYKSFIDLTKKIRASLLKPICLLRKKCPCSDENSVQVKENSTTTPKPKTPITNNIPPGQSLKWVSVLREISLQNFGFTQKSNTTPSTTPPQSLSSHNQIARNSVNHKKTPTMDHHNKEAMMNQFQRPLSEGFTFPLFLEEATATTTTSPMTKAPQVVLNVVHEEEEPPPRPPSPPCDDSLLRVLQPPSSPKSRVMDEDAASDASSDLFEIETLISTHQATTLDVPNGTNCDDRVPRASRDHHRP